MANTADDVRPGSGTARCGANVSRGVLAEPPKGPFGLNLAGVLLDLPEAIIETLPRVARAEMGAVNADAVATSTASTTHRIVVCIVIYEIVLPRLATSQGDFFDGGRKPRKGRP